MEKEWYFISWLFAHPLTLNTGAPIGCEDNTLDVGDAVFIFHRPLLPVIHDKTALYVIFIFNAMGGQILVAI